MDTSRKYIKMWLAVGLEIEIDAASIFVCPKCYAVTNDEGLPLTEWCKCEETLSRRELPRQDELQKMIKKEKQTEVATLHRFYNWLHGTCIYDRGLSGMFPEEWISSVSPNSLEQCWLAFVMHEKFQKVWDGEKEEWVKEE